MKNLLRRLLGRTMAWLLRRRGQPYVFAPGISLVVSPHADDETLGCGGLLAIKQERGDIVHVVYVSNSAGSPEAHPPADQAARRRGEALAALTVLGVPAGNVHFLDAPDGQLDRLKPAEADSVQAAFVALLNALQPTEIFVPYHGGGSTEHDATVTITRNAVARSGIRARLWEYPVWAWWDARRLQRQLARPQENFYLPLGSRRARKQQALACHVSQCRDASGHGPALPVVLADLCTGPVEFFFQRSS